MDALLIILVLIGWVIKTATQGKQKKQQNAGPQKMNPVFQGHGTKGATGSNPFLKGFPGAASSAKGPQTIASKHAPLAEGESHTLRTAFQSIEGAEYVGSLHQTSSEGEDLCEPSLNHDRPVLDVEEGSVYENEIGGGRKLDFSPQGMYQGVVMSEILSRPAQRVRRAH